MRKFYLRKFKAITMAAAMLLSFQVASSQVSITWTGNVSSDVNALENWEPNSAIAGNHLTVPTDFYLTGAKLFPVVTGSEDISVQRCYINMPDSLDDDADPTTPKIWMSSGLMTINLDEGKTFLINESGSSATIWGNINYVVNSGTLRVRPQFRMQNDSSQLVVKGTGIALIENSYWSMGDSNTPVKGGRIVISGNGKVVASYVPNRMRVDNLKEGGQIIITENGVMQVKANWDCQSLIDKGIINGGENYNVIREYDVLANITTLRAVPSSSFVIIDTNRQVLLAGEEGSQIKLLQTTAVKNMKSFVWKYGTSPVGPFDMTFTPGLTNDTINPIFTNSGIFYLVCEGTKADDSKVITENYVNIFVGSDKISFTPDADQWLKIGQTGATITANATGTVTNQEWLWSSVPNGPYNSFPTAVTTNEYTPMGDSTTYYIVYKANINGTEELSSELPVYVEPETTRKPLYWNGSVSTDANYNINWTPAAYMFKNEIFVSDSVANFPIVTAAGNDTIYKLWVNAKTSFTLKKPGTDTLAVRTNGVDYSGGGTINVESGVMDFSTYVRLDNNTAILNIYGTGVVQVLSQSLFIGNNDNPTVGGNVNIYGNGVLKVSSISRWIDPRTYPGHGVVTIADNGKLIWKGDVRTTVRQRISEGRIASPAGYVPFISFDATDSVTIVTALDFANAFRIDPITTQFTGVDQPTNELSLVNATGNAPYEWKFSTTSSGPWESFATPVFGDKAKLSFPAGGEYYVTCIDTTGENTANSVLVRVIDLVITPDFDEQIKPSIDGTTRSVTVPDGVTGQEWMFSTTSGSGYEADPMFPQTDTAYTPNFMDKGVYYVVYQAIATDDNGNDVTIYSKEIMITVTDNPVSAKTSSVDKLNVWPNPSEGAININAGTDVTEFTVEVIDENGVVVSTQNVEGSTTNLSIKGTGVFIVKLISGNTVKIERVVVK